MSEFYKFEKNSTTCKLEFRLAYILLRGNKAIIH